MYSIDEREHQIMFYTCYRALLSGFSGHSNEGRMMGANGVMVAEWFPRGSVLPKLLLCVVVIPEKLPPFTLQVLKLCFIPAGNKGTPMAFPEENQEAVQRKAHPQHFCAPWGFPVSHSETRGPCYLSISAFDVIGALAGRLSVEPGTRCAAWKTQEPSHHLLAQGRLCASRRKSG